MGVITEEYRQVLKDTHKKKQWGNTGGKGNYFTNTLFLMKKFNATKVLDYGAGWGGVKARMLKERPDIEVFEYEPARDDVSAPPEPQDFVICMDVLEHIEPDCLEEVLIDLARVVSDKGFFSIATQPALATLADGRNAHLIVEDFVWWRVHIDKHFTILRESKPHRTGGCFVVEKKK